MCFYSSYNVVFYHAWLKTVWIVSLYMQINYEMVSNAHVRQLIVSL